MTCYTRDAMALDTSITPAHEAVTALRRQFESGVTRSYQWRIEQLGKLRSLLVEGETELIGALSKDLGKSDFEGWLTEAHFTRMELDHTVKHLKQWMKPRRVPASLLHQPSKCIVQREPLGVVLIMGPWNYPAQLTLGPLIGALAAGNCAIIKPSELAPATSAWIAKRLPDYISSAYVRVIEGGIKETTEVLQERYDHICFTGSGNVGRVVMEAAAKHLTPVTLELGGKSPCIVDEDVDLDVAVRRIVAGKFMNAGQTCVAPDYVLVHERVEAAFLAKITQVVKDFYGENAKTSPDLGRIINNRHFERLQKLMKDGTVVVGGQTDAATRFVAPTVLKDVSPDSAIMQEEIFGPLLPVLRVSSVRDAVDFVNARPKPLALYVFTSNHAARDLVLERTSSGGACVNECVLHLGVPELPFGGVGPSGMGAWHGQHSFETFSHRKSVMIKSSAIDPAFRYPPYTEDKKRWIKRLM